MLIAFAFLCGAALLALVAFPLIVGAIVRRVVDRLL